MRNTCKLLALLGVATLVPVAGCNDPLRVSYPDVVPPSALSDSASLATLRAGAIGDFSIAYTGDHPDGSGGIAEGVILYGGLLADEFIDSETFPTRIEVDARTSHVTNSDIDLWYRWLHRARHSAENAAGRYAALAKSDPGYPEMLDLAGMTYIFLAETFCSGVPVSQLNPDGSITYGKPLTTVQLLDTAVARFDSALKVSSDARMTAFAQAGKARALLDLGQFANAATVAALVPDGFAYIQQHTTNTDRENNGVFNAGATDGRYSVADQEGGGFPFRSVADPRTPSVRDPGGFGFDLSTPLFDNLRYGGRPSPITVATSAEARLVLAEAALQTGDTATSGQFFAQLNLLRSSPGIRGYFDPNPLVGVSAIGVLPALADSNRVNAGGAVNLLFNERARWLWLTGHRLGDLRRLMRQYGRPSTVFPTGAFHKPVSFAVYGTDVNLPVPITEQNNPNFTACLDRNP